MNSTDKAYQRDCFLLDFLDSNCNSELSNDISEYDKAIEEYREMLSYAIARNDIYEIAELRREIQHCKAEKRIAKKRLIENQNEMRIALT